MSQRTNALFTTLIRTHHITSRKKLTRVRHEAARHLIPFVLVRAGGCPGIMYAESGDGPALARWLAGVRDLRYKDFRCVQRPARRDVLAVAGKQQHRGADPVFREVASVAEFGELMGRRGLGDWWEVGMGYRGAAG